MRTHQTSDSTKIFHQCLCHLQPLVHPHQIHLPLQRLHTTMNLETGVGMPVATLHSLLALLLHLYPQPHQCTQSPQTILLSTVQLVLPIHHPLVFHY